MRKVTKDVAQWLGISHEHAALVQSDLAVFWGVDFSEVSNSELRMLAKEAHAEMVRNADFL